MRGARVAMGASLGILVLGWVALGEAQTAPEVRVTDQERLWENFRREAAVVNDGQFRFELKGITLQADRSSNGPQVVLRGTPVGEINRNEIREDVREVSGGIISLLGSYGLFPNTEVGFEIQGVMQGIRFANPVTGDTIGGPKNNANTFGDMWLYGKYRYEVMEDLGVAGGVELRLPTGDKDDYTGTGEVGTNPFVSARYGQDRWAVGTHVGYQFNTGNLDDMFNWNADALVRPSMNWAFRAEFTGWHYDYGGQGIDDVYCSPGIDYNFSQDFVIRPQGQVGITKPALGWGLGIGLAYTF